MKRFIFIVLIFFLFSLFGKDFNSNFISLLSSELKSNCPEVDKWSVSNLNIGFSVVSLNPTGRAFCYSGKKKIFVRTVDNKIKVVSFSLRVFKKSFIFTRNLERGIPISSNDVAEKLIELKNPRYRMLVSSVFGMQTSLNVRLGEPVFKNMVRKIILVRSGSEVKVVYQKGGITIVLNGIARSNAGINDTLPVMNTRSKKIFYARINKKGILVAEVR
jgi:flagella basal body P-ring formation protein FlgA